MLKLLFLTIASLVFNASISAASKLSREYFEQLKHLPFEYVSDVGKVCERVAELQLEKEFPVEDYVIVSNVVYEKEANSENRIRLGELDVVVVSKDDSKVVLIAEVKCWQNRTKAAKKAKKQLRRFERTISDRLIRLNSMSIGDDMEGVEVFDSSSSLGADEANEEDKQLIIDIQILTDLDDYEEEILEIYSDDGSFVFTDLQFDNEIEYRAISPLKPDYVGAFHPLELSLKEVHKLTNYLKAHQDNPSFSPKSKRKTKIKRHKRKKRRY
ncbi:MAG: hypothetical protein HRU09_09000 [Oligoflexales bacterium]|nr:hypothetical protein [Oligoflexales bacterium]